MLRVMNRAFLILGILSLIGCTAETDTPSRSVTVALQKVGGPQLRRDAELVAQKFKTQNVKTTDIPETLWSESIRQFKPKLVSWRSDHLAIITKQIGRAQNGILVYFPSHPDDALRAGQFDGGGSGMAKYKIEAGIYWFWEKIRIAPPIHFTNMSR